MNRYQKSVNYKNEVLVVIYTTILISKLSSYKGVFENTHNLSNLQHSRKCCQVSSVELSLTVGRDDFHLISHVELDLLLLLKHNILIGFLDSKSPAPKKFQYPEPS